MQVVRVILDRAGRGFLVIRKIYHNFWFQAFRLAIMKQEMDFHIFFSFLRINGSNSLHKKLDFFFLATSPKYCIFNQARVLMDTN